MKKVTARICGLALLVLGALALSACSSACETAALQSRLVAHGGGAIAGYEGSNSLEALELAVANGFWRIEVDMVPTTDGEIVLNHEWHRTANRIPGAVNEPVSHAEFMEYRLFNKFTPMDLSMLIAFLRDHPEVRIITDTKDEDYAALYAIRERYPEYRDRFIPQAYSFDSVARIRALGFDDVIATIYMMSYQLIHSPGDVSYLALAHEVYALGVPDWFITPEYVAELRTDYLKVFVHTVDTPERAMELFEMGIYGVYTGFLVVEGDPPHLVRTIRGLQEMRERIDTRVEGFTEEQRATLAEILVYELDMPVYVFRGEARSVRRGGVAAPFTLPFGEPDNGEVYLPVRQVFEFFGGVDFTWDRGDGSVTLIFGEDGAYHVIRLCDPGVVAYQNLTFVSATVIEDIFSARVLRIGAFAFVLPEEMDVAEDVLLELAELLFEC